MSRWEPVIQAARRNLSVMARLCRSDVRHLFANVVSMVITIGLIAMPSIFAWYNILACWNVFDHTGNLTVAVANTDEGYESDLVPLRVNVGEQVVSALRANDQIDWTFTDEADAIDGAKAGRYNAAVVIPKDGRRAMLTFYTGSVEHAQIVYYANEKKSAIAPKITDQGADAVSYQVNQVFAETLSEIALGVAESLSNYADTSGLEGRVAAMARSIDEVAGQMESMAAVLGLYGSLIDAARDLGDESAKLVSAAHAEVNQVSGLAAEGAAAAGSIAEAIGASGDALGSALDASAASFDAASSQATGAAERLRAQADAVDGQAAAAQGTVAQLEALKTQVPPEYQPAVQSLIDQLRASIGLMGKASEGLREVAARIEQGSADAEAQRQEVKRLADEAKQGLAAAKADYEANVAPALADLGRYATELGAALEAGKGHLGSADDALGSSLGSAGNLLAFSANRIGPMIERLNAAAAELHEVAAEISDALASGDAEKLRQVIGADVQALAKALAAPVGVERIAVFPADNFGSAMAPLYTTLALFIGSLLILVVVKPTVSARARADLGVSDPTPHALFLGRFGVMAFLSLAQTTLAALGNLLFLQVQVADVGLFLLCFWVAGLVFTFIIYALVAAFANLGKAMAVLLLIIQVTGCGGSFPLQILPPFVQALSPWLPATHVVNAMREAMFGASGAQYWVQMGELLLFLVPAALIGLVLRKPLARFMAWYVEKVESSKVVG